MSVVIRGSAWLRDTTDEECGPFLHIVKGDPQAKILARGLGLRPVPHASCKFDCPATVALADDLEVVVRASGLDEEAGWLEEFRSWPVESSALCEIAEIRTPTLRMSTRTDATFRRRIVRWTARDGKDPVEEARGVRFSSLLFTPQSHD